MGNNETFESPGQIKFVENVLIGHIWGLFQVLKGPFPLDPPIILQGVPNDLTCFLNGPLQIVENEIIPLMPDNPRNTASKQEPNATESFKSFCTKFDQRGIAS